MGHIVAREPWGTVDLITHEGRIFVQQDWLYNFTVTAGAGAWTTPQQSNFHNTLDRQIWANWSDRIRIRVAGNHDLARRYGAAGLRLTFDIRRVTANPHWNVNVRKLPAGSTPTTFISNVDFATRRIELDSADLASYRPANAAGQTRTFFAGPHEFGHTFNNDDEYDAGDTHLADTDSIMNIGNRLRPRHIQLVLEVLNRQLPAVRFTA